MGFKNFVTGMGSILNIFPENSDEFQQRKTDEENIKSDFQKIGKDVYDSMEKLKNEYRFRN